MKTVPADQLYWEVLCSTICYKTHSLLPVSTFWPCCCWMSCKGRTMQHVQWSSSYSAMPYKNAKLRNCQLKMCQLWRATFSKQQHMPSVTQQNAKKMTSTTTKLRITSIKHATLPPLVTSAEFPAVPTCNNSNKVISESLSKTGSSYAAVAHIPRPVALAACTATKAVTIKVALSSSGVQQNIKSKSVESQYPKESSQDASIVEQSIKQGNRKRSAEQSIQSSTPVTDSMTSKLASMQPLSTAETYDK